MSIVCIYAENIRGVDPRSNRTVSVELDMTDAQMAEAVQELLDAMSETQRMACVTMVLEALA